MEAKNKHLSEKHKDAYLERNRKRIKASKWKDSYKGCKIFEEEPDSDEAEKALIEKMKEDGVLILDNIELKEEEKNIIIFQNLTNLNL